MGCFLKERNALSGLAASVIFRGRATCRSSQIPVAQRAIVNKSRRRGWEVGNEMGLRIIARFQKSLKTRLPEAGVFFDVEEDIRRDGIGMKAGARTLDPTKLPPRLDRKPPTPPDDKPNPSPGEYLLPEKLASSGRAKDRGDTDLRLSTGGPSGEGGVGAVSPNLNARGEVVVASEEDVEPRS